MEHVSYENACKKQPSCDCTVWEYKMQNREINLAIAEIRGRYPETGFALNEKCTEIGYVLRGSGRLVTEEKTATLNEGDAVCIPSGEKYYWEGNLTVLLPCSPAWVPEQHRNCLSSEKR